MFLIIWYIWTEPKMCTLVINMWLLFPLRKYNTEKYTAMYSFPSEKRELSTFGMECKYFIPAGMEWAFHPCRKGMLTPFQQEWNAHSIPAGMVLNNSIPSGIEWKYFIPAGMEWAFYSGRNGLSIPFLQEWNAHSIPAGMEWNNSIPVGMEWGNFIPARMEWLLHSCRNELAIPFLQEWNAILLLI